MGHCPWLPWAISTSQASSGILPHCGPQFVVSLDSTVSRVISSCPKYYDERAEISHRASSRARQLVTFFSPRELPLADASPNRRYPYMCFLHGIANFAAHEPLISAADFSGCLYLYRPVISQFAQLITTNSYHSIQFWFAARGVQFGDRKSVV